jgi:hypothetical protein
MNNTATAWKDALKNNVRIQEVFEHTKGPDELQIFSELLEAMTIVSAARTLKGAASHIFLSQCLVTLGIDKETCSCGFVGVEVNKMVDAIANGLLSEAIFTTPPSLVQAMLLKRIVKGLVILSIVSGKMLKLKKQASKKDEKQQESSRIYTDLVFLTGASSGILKQTLKEYISVCGTDEKTKEKATSILFIIAMLLISWASSDEKKEFAKTIELLSNHIKKSLESVDGFLSSEESGLKIKAFITQGILSLENDNIDNFIHVLESLLETSGIKIQELKQDILEIELTTDNINNTITTGLTDFAQNSTEITA